MRKKHIPSNRIFHAGLVLTAFLAITFSVLLTRSSDVSRAQNDTFYKNPYDDPGYQDDYDNHNGDDDFDYGGDLPGHPCGTTHDEDCDPYNTDPYYFETLDGEHHGDEPDHPEPVYDEPTPVYDEPTPVYDEPPPVVDEPYDPSQYDCSMEEEPVCGVNGGTYTNTCWLDLAGVDFAYYGPCQEPVYDEPADIQMPGRESFCTAEVAPVCGVNGNTYSNSCWANKAGVDIAYRGECEEPYYEEPEPYYEEPEPYYEEPEPYYEEPEPYYEAPSVDTSARENMQKELREIDEGMREFTQVLEPMIESMGVDETGILRIMQKLVNIHKQATLYMEDGNEEAFWNTIKEFGRIFENELMPEVQNALMGSNLFVGFQEAAETFNEIKGEVEYLKSTGQQVPRVYSQIERTSERIKNALENSDFEEATRLLESLDSLFREYYEAVEYEGEYEYKGEYEDEFQYEFQPPAGFEEEVITTVGKSPFPDTDMTTLEGRAAAELYKRAVIGGFPDGEFKGDRPVNRAGAAKFLLLAAGISVRDLPNAGRFWDVVEDQWYTSFVMTAAAEGIINGYPDGSFRPADTVNTAEFLKMLSITFGLRENLPHSYRDVPSDAWFARYAGIAEQYQLFPHRGSFLQPAQDLTRAEIAVAIYQYLSNR